MTPAFRSVVLFCILATTSLAQVSQTGQWAPLVNWPFIPVSVAHLSDGRIVGWASTQPTTFPAGAAFTYASIYDPNTGQFTTLNNTAHDMFCAGLASTGDGRIIASGGGANVRLTSTIGILPRWSQSWSRLGDMISGRWYNSSITLPTGNLLTMWGRNGGTLTETFNQNTNVWSALSGISLSSTSDPNDLVDDDNQWFPHFHLMPNGKILMAGPLKTMRWLDYNGQGSAQDIGFRTPDADRHRKLGVSVQYLPGKILFAGGRDDRYAPKVTNTTVLIDATTDTPVTTAGPSMAFARAFHNMVLLPNGEVFAVGGNTSGGKFTDTGGVTVAEIWNPTANQWRSVSAMAVPRGYHMTAILLRDGRVLVGGGGLCGCVADHQNSQIYSPGYLFKADGTAATKPVIDLVATDLKPGLTIGLKGSNDITGFRLVRLQATTHGINSDQRFVPVTHTKVSNGNYSLTLDSNQNVLIPGAYWLFALTASGTPSIGYPVQIHTPGTWPGAAEGDTNLAKGRTAVQSSTENAGTPNRAVDGNTNGVFAQNSVTHTAFQAQAYWQVDLGASALIKSVKLWNRTDCCADRLTNFHVFVSNTPFNSTTVAGTKAQAGVIDLAYPGTAPATVNLAANAMGRYVRVQLEGSNYLQLAEVEVIGSVITNFAPTVSLTSPANGATAIAPGSFVLSANASDPDGNLAKVEFYQGTTKIGESLAAPFGFTWSGVAAGSYVVKARAIDTQGLFAESSVNVVVNPPANRAPTLSIVAPVDGLLSSAPANVNFQVNAADPDGNLARVELFQGATKVSELTASPFNFLVTNLNPGSYAFTVRATDTLGLTVSATRTIRVLSQTLQSLKGVPVPEPTAIATFLKNRPAAVALGKALFWDLQVSSDGTVACATCHFHAGADVRLKNQMNPGTLRTGNPPMTFDNSRTASPNGPNYVVKPGDFPRHALADPLDANSTITYQSKDVMGSHGVMLRNFVSAPAGAVEDACTVAADPVFNGLRRSTGRNTPTVINAVFNLRNFWDGRANAIFNGVDGQGARNTTARIYRGTNPVAVAVSLDNASLASQAVTAALNSAEMSCSGRTWPEVGLRLLPAKALARQSVATADSVLGSFAAAGNKGLSQTYAQMVQAAFADDLHAAATPINIGGKNYTQMQANFSLFFGLAIQLYEATLVSDQAPIDNYFANYPSGNVANPSALSADAIAGMNVFNGKGRCATCHHGPQLTNAATPAREASAYSALISRMRMGDNTAGAYDLGYYNLGIRPTSEDLGIGGTDTFGNPLSHTRQAKAGAIKDNITVDSCSFAIDPCTPLNTSSRDVVDGAFKTPTLRNVALTGPYFHNGSAATLDDVVDFYNRGGNATGSDTVNSTGFGANPTNGHADIRPLGLSQFERDALVTFMKTALTDDRVLYSRAPFDHPELAIANGHTGSNADLVLLPAVGSTGDSTPLQPFEAILAAGDLGLAPTTFNVSPTVALTSPATGATFIAPATVTLNATAATTQGTIAQVEFYNGATLLGTSSTAPYSFTWSSVAAGTYTLTVKAIGSNGTSTTTAPISITVTAASAPTVSLTSPASGASFIAPASVTISATATTTQGTITQVEFYNGATLLGADTTAPYSFTWSSVTAGTFALTAKAIGSNGTSATTAPVSITVTAVAAPTVSLTSPASGASFIAPASVSINATATTTQGTIAQVEFYNGATLLGADTTAPYSFTWSSVAAGTYALTAKAIGSNGTSATTAPINITVTAVAAPTVSLTSPASGASFIAPASVTISATATTTQGTITQVEFYNGATLLGADTTSPYSYAWSGVTAGTYTLTAKAIGSNGTSTTTSPINITVTGGTAGGPNPVGLWPLDSVAGGLTPDTSGANNNGIVAGTFTTVPGQIGQAIQLNPFTGGINTQRSVIDPTQGFTVSIWVKMFDVSSTQSFISQPAGEVSNFFLQIGSWVGRRFVFDLFPQDSTSASDRNATSTTLPVVNTWYHLTGVYDATAKQVRIYVNGQLEGQNSAPNGTFANNGPLAIGYGKYAGIRLDGTDAHLDDVRVFNRPLSDLEVLSVFTGSAPPMPPSVAITAPTSGASFTAPASVTITANASTTDGTITKVEFFNGTTLLGTDTTAPYSFVWSNVAAGSYSVTAKATGSNTAATTSTAVNITVGAAASPAVALTAPANGTSFLAPATVNLSATATTTQGTITQVEFYNGAILLGTDTTAPYTFAWANVAIGSYTITAKAIGSNGTASTSTAATITVSAVVAPTVALTAPISGANFAAPAAITLTANAATTQGTIAQVEFYNGATLLGSDTTSPYSFAWNNVAAGTYTLTAKAIGSNGAATTSLASTITVTTNTGGVPSATARWPLDAVTGGLTPDVSGANNAGVVTGAFSTAAGQIGQALQLNPFTGGITSQRAVIDPTQGFTVSVWVKLFDLSSTQSFVSQPAGEVSNFFLQIGSWVGRRFVFDLFPQDSTSASDRNATSTTVPVANTWYHVTGVYDAATKQVRIYVNGQLEGQNSAPNGTFANTGPLAIGYGKYAGIRLDGTDAHLDDVRVFNRPLTDAEVLSVFNAR